MIIPRVMLEQSKTFGIPVEDLIRMDEQGFTDDLHYIRCIFSCLGVSLPEKQYQLDALMANRKLQSKALGFYETLHRRIIGERSKDPQAYMSPVGNEQGTLSDYNLGVMHALDYLELQELKSQSWGWLKNIGRISILNSSLDSLAKTLTEN